MKRALITVLRLWICAVAAAWPLLMGPAPPLACAQSPEEAWVESLIAGMTVEERVGQLFLVTFVGDEAPPDSDIAELIQRYRVGGVALLTSNGNFQNEGDTPRQVAGLVNQLQRLALTAPTKSSRFPLPTVGGTPPAEPITPTMQSPIPLFIAIDHEGDGHPYTRLINGFTPVPSNMALGATWNPDLAQQIGEVVGQELRAVGINMLLGPSLDVLDYPRPGGAGDMGIRTFGGDPYWVGRMGEAYIRGVHLGSEGAVLTVAKHFPGNGGSDRRPDEEISTVNKSLQELYRIELAPFFNVTQESKLGSPSETEALMTSHIRYRGFQGNIRQLTRPISFDAQNLPALMQLPEFAPWRTAGGLLVSDALGVPAVRKYYDPQLQTFPYRQIAQEAFLAGNDILTLSQFALHDAWDEQFENIKATITFFQEKYVSDADFRARVDASLRRILRQKARLYPEFTPDRVLVSEDGLEEILGKGERIVDEVAKQALTLIYPGLEGLADRLPSPPLPDESIVVFTDTRMVSDCSDSEVCPPYPSVPAALFQKKLLELYGPSGTGQVQPEHVSSFTFADLLVHFQPDMQASLGPAVERPTRSTLELLDAKLGEAKWLVFVMLDIDPERYPSSTALRVILKESEALLRGKNIIVFALAEPYYLDTTEISKLTAYYALYSKMPPFVEVAVRTLFQEVIPHSAPPVSIVGINYDLISATEPDPEQVIQVRLSPLAGGEATTSVDISVGDTLSLATSPILDRNGHPVPDGTPVEFRLFYPTESLELPRLRTVTENGIAQASVVVERVGQLNVTASSGSATRSTTLLVTISSNEPAQISTVEPSPTPTFTPTHTREPTPTRRPTATPTPPPPTATPSPSPTPPPAGGTPGPGSPWEVLGLSLIVLIAMAGLAGLGSSLWFGSPVAGARLALWLVAGGLAGYIVFAQGWVPEGTIGDALGNWSGPLLTVLAGLIVGVISLSVERRRG